MTGRETLRLRRRTAVYSQVCKSRVLRPCRADMSPGCLHPASHGPIGSDQWQLVPPRAQCGLHRDAIGPLLLPVRLLYGGGCADPLSSGLCKTESSALIIPEASIHKPLYPNPLLSHLLLHRMRHRRWRDVVGATISWAAGGSPSEPQVEYGDRGVRYVYIAAGYASTATCIMQAESLDLCGVRESGRKLLRGRVRIVCAARW